MVDPRAIMVESHTIMVDPHAINQNSVGVDHNSVGVNCNSVGVDGRVLSATIVPVLHKQYFDVFGLGVVVVFAWGSTIIACGSQ